MRSLPRWDWVVIAAALAIFAGAALLREHSFARVYFLSGWGLLAALSYDLFRRLRDAGIKTEVGNHAALSLLAASLFATHLELRIPNGWLEGVLSVLFLLLLSNAIMGSLVQMGLRTGVLGPKRVSPDFARGWMTIHVPLTSSIVALGIVHGVLVHSHGVMAWALLGK